MKVKEAVIISILLLPLILLGEIISFSNSIKLVEGKDKGSVLDFLTLLVNFASKTNYNKSAEEFHDYLTRSLDKFEFKDLYNSKYMSSSINGYRSVTYKGVNSTKGFIVDLTETSFDKIPIKQFGDFAVEYSLKKNIISSVANGSYSNSSSYSGNLKLNQNLGVFSHEKGSILLDSLFSIISIENLEKINLPASKTFPNLKNIEERKILDLILADLPSVNQFLNQYFTADSLLKEMDINGKRAIMFNLVGKINNRYVQNKYPFLASFLDDISDLGWIYFILYNSTGNRILEIRLDSSTLLLYCKFYTSSGKIIPYSENKTKDDLDFSNAISIQSLTSFSFKIQVSFQAEIYGLIFKNKDIRINGNYTRKAGEGNIHFLLDKIQKTSVSGGFSYLVPAWAINLVIPGNMEELIFHFTSVLVKANADQGSYLQFNWKKNSSYWVFATRSEAEFVDNFFIRFGLKVFNYKIRPSKEAGEEISQFLVQIFELAKKDLSSSLYTLRQK